jgi:hypothetical protein
MMPEFGDHLLVALVAVVHPLYFTVDRPFTASWTQQAGSPEASLFRQRLPA